MDKDKSCVCLVSFRKDSSRLQGRTKFTEIMIPCHLAEWRTSGKYQRKKKWNKKRKDGDFLLHAINKSCFSSTCDAKTFSYFYKNVFLHGGTDARLANETLSKKLQDVFKIEWKLWPVKVPTVKSSNFTNRGFNVKTYRLWWFGANSLTWFIKQWWTGMQRKSHQKLTTPSK